MALTSNGFKMSPTGFDALETETTLPCIITVQTRAWSDSRANRVKALPMSRVAG
jgi:hypothetical protein